MVGTDDADLRAAFHSNWTSRGWTPIQLDPATANRHPLAQTFSKTIPNLPTVNWPDYEAASWRRYLALAQWFNENPTQAHALFLDYDIFNRKLTPHDLLPHAAANGITLLTAHDPDAFGALLLNRHAASILPLLILAIAPLPELTLTLHDGRHHISDFLFLTWLRDWSHLANEFTCQQLFNPLLLADSRPAHAYRASALPLIHLSNAVTRFSPNNPAPRAPVFNALLSFFP
jgi:hypothetical protein